MIVKEKRFKGSKTTLSKEGIDPIVDKLDCCQKSLKMRYSIKYRKPILSLLILLMGFYLFFSFTLVTATHVCGDGEVDDFIGPVDTPPHETCDDEDTKDGDGCSSSCQVEPGYYCEGDPSDCYLEEDIICGNERREPGEQCDDGNEIDGDGCNSECKDEFCGDGIVNNNDEQCDDDNLKNDDTCNNLCQFSVCGNSIIDGEDECDDGDDDNGDSCTSLCRIAFCGDGFNHRFNEECDDGNEIDGDGCSLSCILDRSFSFELEIGEISNVIIPPSTDLTKNLQSIHINGYELTRLNDGTLELDYSGENKMLKFEHSGLINRFDEETTDEFYFGQEYRTIWSLDTARQHIQIYNRNSRMTINHFGSLRIFDSDSIYEDDFDGILDVDSQPIGENDKYRIWGYEIIWNPLLGSLTENAPYRNMPFFDHLIISMKVLDENRARITLSNFLPDDVFNDDFLRGDVDRNGKIELADSINILRYLFNGDFEPNCLDALDVNDDGVIEISDAINLLQFQFLGKFDIPNPTPPEKGPDPTLDSLDCIQYT